MDKYTKVKIIGKGSFGRALLVRDKGSGQQYVVKEIPMKKKTPKVKEYASNEVAVLAQMNHPNIVRYIESFEENDNLHIVMNFCENGDLYHKIRSQKREFPEDQVMEWFVQIALAIQYIHDRNILHRDIKTKNIFLTSGGAVQLGDFGISKALGSMEFTKTVIGTPYNCCPEICERKPYNNKSDIWSLGCVLYELTTLKHPFEAKNKKDLLSQIRRCSPQLVSSKYSYDLRVLINGLLKREPKGRPSIDSILKLPFVKERVKQNVTDKKIKDEFSPTTTHCKMIHNKIQPSKPSPSHSPASRPSTNEPISVGRPRSTPPMPTPADAHMIYKQANINGVPQGRESDVGSLVDKKSKGMVRMSLLGSNEKERLRECWGKKIEDPVFGIKAGNPKTSRSLWDLTIEDRLKYLPLQETASSMEATSELDKVIWNPDGVGPSEICGQPGGTIMNAHKQMPKIEVERTITSDRCGRFNEHKGSPRPQTPMPTPAATHNGEPEERLSDVRCALELKREDDLNGVIQRKGRVRECRECWGNQIEKPVFGIKVANPKRSRLPWNPKIDDRLKDLPLQETASAMEATCELDKVIRNPGDVEPRGVCGQPGGTIMDAPKNMPTIEVESTITSDRCGTFNEHNEIIPSLKGSTESRPIPGFGETFIIKKPTIYKEPTYLLATEAQSDITRPTEKEGWVLKAVNVIGEGSLFKKVELELEDTDAKIPTMPVEHKLTVEEFQDDILKDKEIKCDSGMEAALTTGPFDMRNSVLLRTRSEPDLSKQSDVDGIIEERRSLDLEINNEEDKDDNQEEPIRLSMIMLGKDQLVKDDTAFTEASI